MLSAEQGGRIFRLLWIEEMSQFVAEPKASHVAPWEEMRDWERKIASAVFLRVQECITGGQKCNREQGGRYLRLFWIEELQCLYQKGEIEVLKVSLVAPWEEMQKWECEVDRRIYERLEAVILNEKSGFSQDLT